MKATQLSLVWLFTLLLTGVHSTFAQPADYFSTDADGWTTVGMCPAESAPGTPTWNAAGGNPRGCISATDESVGVFYWVGGDASWKGNLSAYYGCYLLFDLKTDVTNFQVYEYDVAIIATDDSALTYNATPNPGTGWTSYVIPLFAGSWIVDGQLNATDCPNLTGATATAADMLNYMAIVKRFRIRAEFSGLSYETNWLDNVMIDCDLFLPVEMITFNAIQIGTHVARLNWTTESEQDCDGFIIQKSINGVTFDSIGFVYGNGTTTFEHNYIFDDDNFDGTCYYRLKQIDYNGQFEYSNIISLTSAVQFETTTLIYPNPATNQLFVAGPFPIAAIRITSLNGSIVYDEWLNVDSETSDRTINTENLPAGVYTITLMGKLETESYLFEIIK